MKSMKRATLQQWLKLSIIGIICMLAACGQEQNNNGTEEATASDEDSSEPIVLYANDFDEVIEPMFEEATGYEMEVVHGGGGEILSRLEAEQANPQWDVVWTGARSSLHRFSQEGLFHEGFEPRNLEHLNERGQELLPNDLSYYPMSVHAAAVIAYNTELIEKADVPTNWANFLDYDGNITMADPGVAAPAYPVVSYIFNELGMDEAKEKFSTLFEEDRLLVHPKNGPVGEALINGDAEIAALQEHHAYDFKFSDEPIDLIWPEDGASGSVRTVAISEGTDNLEASQAFVNFLLDPETQTELAELDAKDSYFTPLAEGATADPDRKENPDIGLPDVNWASEHEAEIKEWFADRAID